MLWDPHVDLPSPDASPRPLWLKNTVGIRNEVYVSARAQVKSEFEPVYFSCWLNIIYNVRVLWEGLNYNTGLAKCRTAVCISRCQHCECQCNDLNSPKNSELFCANYYLVLGRKCHLQVTNTLHAIKTHQLEIMQNRAPLKISNQICASLPRGQEVKSQHFFLIQELLFHLSV